MNDDLKLLLKAQSMIQREAILAALAEGNIETATSPRDMSRKVADDTVDLALEGYSVFFDGFPIYVREKDVPAAQDIVNRLMAQAEMAGREKPLEEESPHFRKFFFCTLFTFIVPGVLHVAGMYHLYMAFKNGERVPLVKLVLFLAIYLLIPSVLYVSLIK